MSHEIPQFDPEEIENARLAKDVDKEREEGLRKVHGVSSSDLTEQANVWLAAAGYVDSVAQTESLEKDYSEQYALAVNRAGPRDVEELVRRQEETGLAPYTPDAIASLESTAIVRILNGFRRDEEDDSLVSALQALEDTPLSETHEKRMSRMSERKLVKGFGEHGEKEVEEAFDEASRTIADFISRTNEPGEDEDEQNRPVFTFEGSLIQSLGERLISPNHEERESAIAALDELDEAGLQAILEGDPAIVQVLVECAHEISNDNLRNFLLELRSLSEEQDDDGES